ncbi:MAG: polysulfide reductase NrfD, partial [Candidatus Marsarchaeota archaeon]|nr:polysulfide reductase NrfD [Candidatus Marsarchaeota archaeon]
MKIEDTDDRALLLDNGIGNGDHKEQDWISDARRAAIAPTTGHTSVRWRLSVSLLSLVVLAGVVAWIYQLKHGLGAAGYNDQAFWAVYIVDVVAFIGVSYGGAVISAILRLTGQSWRAPLTRLAEGTALVTVIIGALFIFPHLGRPERFWEILVYVNTSSPLFWDFLAIGTYIVATVIFFYLPLIPDMAIANKLLGQSGRRYQFKLYKLLSLNWMGTKRQRSVIHGAIGIIAL